MYPKMDSFPLTLAVCQRQTQVTSTLIHTHQDLDMFSHTQASFLLAHHETPPTDADVDIPAHASHLLGALREALEPHIITLVTQMEASAQTHEGHPVEVA